AFRPPAADFVLAGNNPCRDSVQLCRDRPAVCPAPGIWYPPENAERFPGSDPPPSPDDLFSYGNSGKCCRTVLSDPWTASFACVFGFSDNVITYITDEASVLCGGNW